MKDACNLSVTIALRRMGRNWIKIETVTMDKPEVCVVATQLKMDPDAVVGKLVRLWSWAEVNRIKSNEMHVTLEFLDKLVGKKGFAAALMKAGWLQEEAGILRFPNFGRHNGPAGKGRALTAQRVSRLRDRRRNEDESVTEMVEEPESDSKAGAGLPRRKNKAVNQRKNTIKALLKSDLTENVPSFTGQEKGVHLPDADEDEALEVKSEMVELSDVPDVVFEEVSPSDSGVGALAGDYDDENVTELEHVSDEHVTIKRGETLGEDGGKEVYDPDHGSVGVHDAGASNDEDEESPFEVSEESVVVSAGELKTGVVSEVAETVEAVPKVKKGRAGGRKSGGADSSDQPMLF